MSTMKAIVGYRHFLGRHGHECTLLEATVERTQ